MITEFDGRRRLIGAGLERLGLKGPKPRGAFYAFPDLSPWFDERGAPGLATDLLETKALATVPGTVFGAPNHIRLSYALSRERLEEALKRLGDFLAERPRD